MKFRLYKGFKRDLSITVSLVIIWVFLKLMEVI
jgi:hypothetical protein